MENSIILPIDGVKSVSQYLNCEQLGELILALIAPTSGEDPGEMEPAVGLAYCFLKDRVRARSEICDPIAEYSDITKVQLSNQPESGSDPSDHSKSRSDDSTGVPDNSNGNNASDTAEEHKTLCKRSEKGSLLSISQKNTVSANELFEKLWKLYPNKKGKGKISDARKRTLLTIGEDQMTRAIQRYVREHDTKLKNGEFVPCWQNGSTFFNSGYVDYLDENYSAAPKNQSHPKPQRCSFQYGEQSNTDWNDVFFQALLLQEEEAALVQEPNEISKDRKSASHQK